MKLKTSELTGAALDYACAMAEGHKIEHSYQYKEGKMVAVWWQLGPIGWRYLCEYSTNWAIGGPIIEREGIEVRKGNDLYFPQGNENGDYYEPLWLADKQHGPTPLIAAMRCYVTAKLGNEVEVPEELA